MRRGLYLDTDMSPRRPEAFWRVRRKYSRALVLVEVFLRDRNLHFEPVDPVFEEEDFLGFGTLILGRHQPGQRPSRQAGRQPTDRPRPGNRVAPPARFSDHALPPARGSMSWAGAESR
jgi:hypothetical protein